MIFFKLSTVTEVRINISGYRKIVACSIRFINLKSSLIFLCKCSLASMEE